MSMLHSVA
jgi:hypothetical protein